VIVMLLAMQAALHSPRLQPPPPPPEIRTGKLVYYSKAWGDWTCPPLEKCGIAARQGVATRPGEWCVATWYREDLDRMGTLQIGTRTFRVRVCDYAHPVDLPRIQARGIVAEIPYPLAATVPGMIGSGWTMGTLTLAPIAGIGLENFAANTRAGWLWAETTIMPRLAISALSMRRPLPQPW